MRSWSQLAWLITSFVLATTASRCCRRTSEASICRRAKSSYRCEFRVVTSAFDYIFSSTFKNFFRLSKGNSSFTIRLLLFQEWPPFLLPDFILHPLIFLLPPLLPACLHCLKRPSQAPTHLLTPQRRRQRKKKCEISKQVGLIVWRRWRNFSNFFLFYLNCL